MRPLRVRKIEAYCGEANSLRSSCSSVRPRIPAGIVPTTRSQPSFASGSATSRSRSDRPSPLMIRTQSRQKNASRTSAVAMWSATRKLRKYGAF
jgi:hypothetical protein